MGDKEAKREKEFTALVGGKEVFFGFYKIEEILLNIDDMDALWQSSQEHTG
jgi:hypothetical protein